jgi:hypothetical protein
MNSRSGLRSGRDSLGRHYPEEADAEELAFVLRIRMTTHINRYEKLEEPEKNIALKPCQNS